MSVLKARMKGVTYNGSKRSLSCPQISCAILQRGSLSITLIISSQHLWGHKLSLPTVFRGSSRLLLKRALKNNWIVLLARPPSALSDGLRRLHLSLSLDGVASWNCSIYHTYIINHMSPQVISQKDTVMILEMSMFKLSPILLFSRLVKFSVAPYPPCTLTGLLHE